MNIWIYELTKIAQMRRNLHFEGRQYAKKPFLRFPGLCEDSQSRGSRSYEYYKYWRYNTEAVTFGIY